jgi:hypothetical protein
MAILFHGNFALVRPRVAGLMKLVLQRSEFKDKVWAEPFGYDAPFAAFYRSWLHKTGLTKLRLPLELTEMGKIVFENDPSLESQIKGVRV